MTAPRDVGDRGRIPAPPWFLRELLFKAAELLDEVGGTGPDDEWELRLARWREVWAEVRASD